MAKLSRKARKVLRTQKTLTSKVAVAIAAATLAVAPVQDAEPKPVAAPVLTVVADAPPAEPVPWSERFVEPRPIPPPPESGVRLIAVEEPDPKELARQFREKMDHFDNERRLDLAIRAVLHVCLSVDDVLRITYYVSLNEFLLRCRWSSTALGRVRVVQGITLWSVKGVPTPEGEAAWESFRRRIRRGALRHIVENKIRSPFAAPVVRIDRYRSVERVA